jgi:hypothetical protein
MLLASQHIPKKLALHCVKLNLSLVPSGPNMRVGQLPPVRRTDIESDGPVALYPVTDFEIDVGGNIPAQCRRRTMQNNRRFLKPLAEQTCALPVPPSARQGIA